MAQKVDTEELKTEEEQVVPDLRNVLPQTKFSINYKDKNQLPKDVHYIANHLFPLTNEEYKPNTDISKSNYTLSVIQGGITNLLYLLTPNTNKDENKSPQKLLIRVYGENTEVLIDRNREEKLFYELGQLRFGPIMYGIFGNGRIEQWYDNAHAIKLHERKHCKQIAETLADMHSLHPKLLKSEQSESLLWKTVNKWYGIASNVEFKDDAITQKKWVELDWNNILKQIDFMKVFLPSDKNDNDVDKLFAYIVEQQNNDKKDMVSKMLNGKINKIAFSFMFDVVFTHNDLLGGNILHLQDTKEIKFVDFEYGAYSYRAFDFANHFCEYAGFDCDWKKHFPEKEHIKQFVNDYVDTLCNNNTYKKNINEKVINLFNKQNGFTDKDYNEFLDSCSDIIVVFTCVDHYFWGLWGVVQSRHSPIDFDFIQYANDRLISGYQFSLTLLPDYLNFPANKQQ